MKRDNVIDSVVENGRCIGCGACAAICPAGDLHVEFNEYGEYRPYGRGACRDACSLCLNVCPFHSSSPDQRELGDKLFREISGMRRHDEMGYYLETGVAWNTVEKERMRSTSGGVGKALLKRLLAERLVDRVVSVVPHDDPEKLFAFAIISDPDDIDRCSASAYYPTELSEVFAYIRANEGTCAITVLPCFAQAVRLMQSAAPVFRQRIKYVIGLTCGQVKNKAYTRVIGRDAAGIDAPVRVNYRKKIPGNSANMYGFEYFGPEGESVIVERRGAPATFWGLRLFTPPACNHCDDVFAETADIVLMDAWLPEYMDDYRGHTLTIHRSRELRDALAGHGTIHEEPIAPDRVALSQKGVTRSKRRNRAFAVRGFGSGYGLLDNLTVFMTFRNQMLSRRRDRVGALLRINMFLTKVLKRIAG